MVIKALMRLFGAGSDRAQEETPKAAAKAVPPKTNKSASSGTPGATLSELEGFVDYVVKALVDYPDEVRVSSGVKGEGKVIQIICRESDRGKIIGKKGKTIIALRALVAGAAGRMQDRVTVEVLDDEDEVKG